MIRRLISAAITTTVLFTNCSMFVSAPDHIETGSRVVCILYDESDFKEAVVGEVAVELAAERYTVITDRVKRAKYYHAADFGAVVYMAEYWMWHVPWHQTSYYEDNGEPSNTVFVVTAGDPDVTIEEPFDAITSVSKESEVETVANDILNRLEGILK